MANILYGTTWISEDEPCIGLFEMHLQAPNNSGFHRYQVIYVMRNGKPAEYREDMGLASKFKGVDQLRIPGGAKDEDTGVFHIEETVGRLREIAHYLRTHPPFDKRDYEALDEFHDRTDKRIIISA